MKYTLVDKGLSIPPSAYPFTLTYVSIETGEPVEQFVIESIPEDGWFYLPNVSRMHGIVRTRIEWPDGEVQEQDPPGYRTLPDHAPKMLTFANEVNAQLAFRRCYMANFYRPYGCNECGKWHVYLCQWMPYSQAQEVIAVDPMPGRTGLYERASAPGDP